MIFEINLQLGQNWKFKHINQDRSLSLLQSNDNIKDCCSVPGVPVVSDVSGIHAIPAVPRMPTLPTITTIPTVPSIPTIPIIPIGSNINGSNINGDYRSTRNMANSYTKKLSGLNKQSSTSSLLIHEKILIHYTHYNIFYVYLRIHYIYIYCVQ